MAISVQMPALGESVTEGTVTRWLKQEGDTVEVDEPLLEVSTDKVDTEIPSPAAGVLTKIVAQEDDTVEVGGELAQIGEAGEGGGEAPAASSRRAEPEPEPEPEAARAEQAEPEPEPEPESAACARRGRRSVAVTATPVLMPELGESVTEGTVTRWLKKVGDSVEVDEALVEVSTDKVDTEIPSPVAGTLRVDHRRGGRHRRRRRRAGQDRRRGRGPGGQARAQAGTEARTEAGAQARAEARAQARAEAGAQARAQARTQARAQARTQAGARRGGQGGFRMAPTATRTSPRWCGSWPPRTASTWRRSRAPASADASASRTCWRPPKPRRPRAGARSRAARRCRSRPGRHGRARPGAGAPARHHPEGQPDPADHGQEDPRIPADHRPADADPRGRPDQDRRAAGQGQGEFRRARGRQPDVPAVLRPSR